MEPDAVPGAGVWLLAPAASLPILTIPFILSIRVIDLQLVLVLP